MLRLSELLTIINLGLLLANLLVLAMGVKVYTEFAKERMKRGA